MKNPRLFAVIVAVEDYSDFDPSGAANLPGAGADAKGWLHYVLGTLGCLPENVVVLTKNLCGTRTGDPSHSVRHLEATAANIQGAVEEMGERMRAQNAPCTGIFAYNGHGLAPRWAGKTRQGKSLGIAPCDMRLVDGGLHGAILFPQLERWLGALPEQAQLSSFLDCCYSVLPEGVHMAPKLQAPGLLERGPFAGPTVLASQLWGSSYFIDTADGPRGAFTWALLTLLPQWTLRLGLGVYTPNVSYGDLVFRVRALLDVMGIEQAPVLVGDSRNSMSPVFYPTLETHIATARTPDKVRRSAQLDDDADHDGYTLLSVKAQISGGPQLLALVVVANSANVATAAVGQVAGTETWFLQDPPADLSGASRLIWEIVEQKAWSQFTAPSGTAMVFKAPVAGNPRGVGAPLKQPTVPGTNPQSKSFALSSVTGVVQPFAMTWFWNDAGFSGFTLFNNQSDFAGTHGCLRGLALGTELDLLPTPSNGAPQFTRCYLSDCTLPSVSVGTPPPPPPPTPSTDYWAGSYTLNTASKGHGAVGSWVPFTAETGSPVVWASFPTSPPRAPQGQAHQLYLWRQGMSKPKWVNPNDPSTYP